jgi:hypothetical protein
VEKVEPLSILVELYVKPDTTETRMEVPQNTKTKLAYDGPIPLLGHAQRNRTTCSRDTCISMFYGTIHNSQAMESD